MNKILGNNFNQNKRVSRKLCLSNSEKENFSQPSTFERKKLTYISIFDIYPNENQPRKIFNTVKLNALAESIKSLGLLQPITVEQKDKTGKYRIIAGERRYRAAKMANLSELPCIVLKNTDIKNSLISLTENVQRENLNIFEEADALKNILKNSNYTQESLAKELGKAQCTIANKLRLLKFTPKEKELIIQGDLSERHCREFIRESNLEKRLEYINEAIENKLTVSQVKQIIDCDHFLYGNNKISNNTKEIIDDFNDQIYFEEEKVIKNNFSENKKAVKNLKSEKPKKQLFYIKDIRLFINTINKAIEIMKESGINANSKKTVCDDMIEYIIKIPVNCAMDEKSRSFKNEKITNIKNKVKSA